MMNVHKWFMFLTLLMSALLHGAAIAEDRQITVVFRYDDYSSRPEGAAFEAKLIEAFRKYDISATYGVIPYVCAGDCHDPHEQRVLPLNTKDAEMLSDLNAAGKLEVALHGYSHQTLRPGPPYSEFVGLPLSEQIQRITKGKKHLERLLPRKVTTFIPPWNSYDSNTLRALEHCGFQTMSAANNCKPGDSAELRVLPATCGLLDSEMR